MGTMLCKCTSPGCLCSCRLPWTKDIVNNDTAWKQQNKEAAENPMYQYMDLNRGGKLVEAYTDHGPDTAKQMIREEIVHFLYNRGKGEHLTKAKWVRWRSRLRARMEGNSEVDPRSDEQVLAEYKDDKFNKFEDHEACWDINKRGGVGETVCHLCFLMDSPAHLEIAKLLLSFYPKLTLDIYEGDEYYGESSLHIAIVTGNVEGVKLLVLNGAKVNQRATGRFFLPEDQKALLSNTASTDYEGYAYFGEYPLAFAASSGREEIFNYLIDNGADPNLQDTFGNTVLHMVVIHNQVNMYRHAVRHPIKTANTYIKNAAGLTPLTLASKLGRQKIFQEIIELSSIEIWRYSNITCSTYPLTALDTIGPDGSTNWKSALMFIIEGKTDEHLQMLDGGVISQLLDDKWKYFARRRFFEQLIFHIIYLIILSTAVYLRPRGSNQLLGAANTEHIIRWMMEIFVVVTCAVKFLLQISEIKSQGIAGFAKNLKSAPAKTIFIFSCLLILACVPLRFFGLVWHEEVLLTITLPGSWIFFLYFARGIRLYGPFVTMIYKMLRGDLVRFAIIYLVILICFAQGFFFLFKDIDNESITTFKTILDTLMTLFQMTLGEFKMSKGDMGIKYEEFGYTRYATLTKIVFFFFMVLVPILLLNMLIAMMGNTYQQVIDRSEKEWKRQKAQIIVNLERSYSRKQLKQLLFEYSVKLGKPPKDFRGDYAVGQEDQEHRGLMVIKTSNKTKAKQRKGAIINWKLALVEVKRLLREHKKKGHKTPFEFPGSDRNLELSTAMDSDGKEFLTTPRIHYINSRRASTGSSLNGMPSAGLASAVEQLAWERDLDLSTAGLTPVPNLKEIESSKLGSDIKFTDVDSNISVFKSESYQGSWIGDFEKEFHEDTIKTFKAPDKVQDDDVINDPLFKDILESKPQKHGFVNIDSAVTTDIDCLDDEADAQARPDLSVPVIRVARPSIDGTPGGHSLDSSTSADSRRELVQEEKKKKRGHKKSKKSLEHRRHHSPAWSKRSRVENFDAQDSRPEPSKHVKSEVDSRPSSAFPAKPMGSMSSLLMAWDDDNDGL
ncbi:transient receptor potential cation channel subfamily V member 6-like isoform X2 [Lineus longissimus]|uniref:transient receptor potential cation channel subfamily V member 6-like isoform X2 n=1 Tax=Lineus longissimus TaxID=88925 RepID=UPI00315C5E30